MQLVDGRPGNTEGRPDKEIRVYDFLDSLGIAYKRVDHEAAMTMEACEEIDRTLSEGVEKGVAICKNLFLCNRQATDFYLLLIPGDKPLRRNICLHRSDLQGCPLQSRNTWNSIWTITPGSVSVMGLMNDKEKKVRLLIDKDVLQDEYFACHPCINTSSLRFKTSDLMEKVIPAMGHEPTMVCL